MLICRPNPSPNAEMQKVLLLHACGEGEVCSFFNVSPCDNLKETEKVASVAIRAQSYTQEYRMYSKKFDIILLYGT